MGLIPKVKLTKKRLSLVSAGFVAIGVALIGVHLLTPSHAQTLSPAQYYAQFSNGLPSGVFPIAVWLQEPETTTGIESGYTNLANAAKAEGINTFLGFYDWPSAYGTDAGTGGGSGEMQAACNAGEYMIVGGDPTSNTDASSVASVLNIANSEIQAGTGTSCAKYLIGYDWTDEPDQCTADVPSEIAAIHADDGTRMALENMASWVTWGDSGCASTANANFAAPDVPGSDDYHDIDAWNQSNAEGGCRGGEDVSTSPWDDCSWLYGYQADVQGTLSGGKPTWVFLEVGNDALGFSEQNGSSCNTTTNVCSGGNEYNATAPQVNANAWASLINGAAGLEWFCHGTAQGQGLSDSDCMGGNGSASNAIFSNLQYIDGVVQSYAPELLSGTQGSCTMQPVNDTLSLSTTCSGGDLNISTSSSSEPIMGMTKIVGGNTYLFVESDRANGSTTGTYTVSGDSNDTATLVYDSAAEYDSVDSEQGQTFNLNSSGQFSDILRGDDGQGTNNYGATSNSYEVKIYEIAGAGGSTTPPTVSISSPTAHTETYGSSYAINSSATANNGGSISNVKLLVNGTIIATDNSAPYNFSLNTLNYHDNTYTIEVEATDNAGNTNTASESVYVSNGDFTDAGSVGLSDLAILASNWGKTGQTYAQGNITGQSAINISDLSVLAANWGWSE